jgi:hypothetical protein
MAPLLWFLPYEKQQNAASPKPVARLSFWWVILVETNFFFLTKQYLVWLWVNLTHSHVIRRALKRMHL